MTITRANVEAELIQRVGGLFTAAGLDGTTVTGTNANLNGPIAYALRQSGYSVATATVADSDLTDVVEDDYDQLFDLAEYRALKNALGKLRTLVNITVGSRSESLGQMADGLQKQLESMRAEIDSTYGFNVGTLEAGVINLGFQQTDTDSLYS